MARSTGWRKQTADGAREIRITIIDNPPSTHGRSRTAAKGFTSHWLRLISASIAASVGDSISHWADVLARGLLDTSTATAATA